jgi:hypothetical protein
MRTRAGWFSDWRELMVDVLRSLLPIFGSGRVMQHECHVPNACSI